LGHNHHQITPQPINLGGKTVHSFTAGAGHTLILYTDGSLCSFGNNECGQLGLGHYNAQNTPQRINLPEGKTVQSLAAGCYHTLILCTDGSLYGCGHNEQGQLGRRIGMWGNLITKPVLIKMKPAERIAAGAYHTLILCTDVLLYSFGKNSYGQLGLGTQGFRESTPKRLPLSAFENEKVVEQKSNCSLM
jgi:alpha-tubulin suppressor-like RCC1 family protein